MTDALEPRDWEGDIYPAREDEMASRPVYADFGGLRSYDGRVYLAVEDGWVALEDVVAALREVTGSE
jgi:hypothetical protein